MSTATRGVLPKTAWSGRGPDTPQRFTASPLMTAPFTVSVFFVLQRVAGCRAGPQKAITPHALGNARPQAASRLACGVYPAMYEKVYHPAVFTRQGQSRYGPGGVYPDGFFALPCYRQLPAFRR